MKNQLVQLIARKPFQTFFSLMHKFALAGMNYGGGGDLHISGEGWVLSYLSRIFGQKKLTLFDVGANIGEYSQVLAQTFGSRAEIFAFEPASETYTLLQNNTKNTNIVPIKLGFGEKKTRLPLFSAENKSGFSSIFNRRLDHYGITFSSKEIISIDSIDHFCDLRHIKVIHFLKIDVEGYELSVLKGAHKMLKKKAIKAIQFEFGGCDIDSRTFFQDFYYILTPNYTIYRILQDGIVPITSYSEIREIFVNTNYLALLK
jgi:FkbM family methyltransferase